MTQKPDFSKEALKRLKVIVVGDVMLDRYIHGEVNRISPESPVPVLSVTKENSVSGGAGNVYANLKALGVNAGIIGIIGDDQAGKELSALCGEGHQLLTVQDRPTIEKTRFIGNGQQMLRTDREKIMPLAAEDETRFIAAVTASLNGANALILSDYGKGSLSDKVLHDVINAGQKAGVKILVDPKGYDYTRYHGADVVTPNRKELGEATNEMPTETDTDMTFASRKLLELSGIKSIVATRSADGMTVLTGKADEPVHLKTEAREVFDVSGAGDTVIAALAVALAAGEGLVNAAKFANRAAGIVVGKAGTAVVTADELLDEAQAFAWVECPKAKAQIDAWQAQGLKVGFTNGCFDILHAGHVTYLQEARAQCDRLVVALNHDNSVRILKGPTRPVNDENSRATVLSALACVDMVTLFGAEKQGEDNTPVKVIDYLRPDIFFKGGDYSEDQLPEAKIVRAYGGDVRLMGLTEGKSTTNIIKKIAQG